MFTTNRSYLRQWLGRRKQQSCKYCNHPKTDPVSLMCNRCFHHWRRYGSPTIKTPHLGEQLAQATAIVSRYDLTAPTVAFDEWMDAYVSPAPSKPLRRLCWLHFKHLRTEQDKPLMTLYNVLVQTLAVTLYEEQQPAAFDNTRNQFQYTLGRASVSVWGRSRQVAVGTKYNKEERKQLQRRPRLFHQAFDKVFLQAGVAKVVAYIRQNHTTNNQSRDYE